MIYFITFAEGTSCQKQPLRLSTGLVCQAAVVVTSMRGDCMIYFMALAEGTSCRRQPLRFPTRLVWWTALVKLIREGYTSFFLLPLPKAPLAEGHCFLFQLDWHVRQHWLSHSLGKVHSSVLSYDPCRRHLLPKATASSSNQISMLDSIGCHIQQGRLHDLCACPCPRHILPKAPVAEGNRFVFQLDQHVGQHWLSHSLGKVA